MDLRSNPFPAKHQPPKPKPKPNRKMIEASKITSKEPAISREKRVFGTVRNTNVPTRTATEKPAIKLSIGVPQKQPQRTRPARPRHVTEVAKKNSPENAKPKLNERTIRHQEESGEKTPIAGPRIPVDSPSLSQPKTEGSTYRSAKICSKCRFDRLETSSYWLAQIKLAESVGRHFVSAAFFRLALESKAEPIQKLNLELKRYLARNGRIAGQREWNEVCFSYGLLLKSQSETEREDFGTAIRELNSIQTTTNLEVDQEQVEDGEHNLFCSTERS